jgi:colanic acid biosynthesis glycosyl transferase WcaI
VKILIYSLNFSPELVGIGKYSGEMATWLANSGHDVRIVCAPPYYPQWKIYPKFSALHYKKTCKDLAPESLGSMIIYRCPIWIPSSPSAIKRLLHLASFAISSLPLMLLQISWRPNVILVVEPPLFCAPTTLLVSILSGAKSWIHIQDFEVDAAFNLGIMKSKQLKRIVLNIERRLLKLFDRSSTISNSMLTKLFNKGVTQDRLRLFPNWININEIYPMKQENYFRKALKIDPQTCIALYSGNMGEKQGLTAVIDAAKLIGPEEKILFILCGEGSERDALVKYAKGAHNILWLPLQPSELLNDLLNCADIHLLPQRKGLGELMKPSKLLGMQASGRPIIAMADPETELETEVSQCGIVAKPGDFNGFALAIKYLANKKDERIKMGLVARLLSIEHSQEVVLKKFEHELNSL